MMAFDYLNAVRVDDSSSIVFEVFEHIDFFPL